MSKIRVSNKVVQVSLNRVISTISGRVGPMDREVTTDI